MRAIGERYSALGDGPTTGFFDRRSGRFRVESTRSFLRRANGVAHSLHQAGISAGDHVMVTAGTPEATWLGFLGSTIAGAIPVLLPIRPALDPEWLAHSRLNDAHHALPDARLLVHVNESGKPCVSPTSTDWVPLDTGCEPIDASDLPKRSLAPGAPHHLQFTSGSTGALKAVVMTHDNVLAQGEALRERIDLEPTDHLVSWLPLYHDMGLVGIALNALVNGAHLRLMTPFDFLSDPTHWLRAVSDAPAAITAAPNFAFEYTTRRARDDRMEGVDLSSWKKCYCGAEPVDPRTLANFFQRFRHHGLDATAIHPTYGLAEATLMATMPRTGEAPRQVTIRTDSLTTSGPLEVVGSGPLLDATDIVKGLTPIASLGPPGDGIAIEILDESGRPTDGEEVAGEVVISGTSVTPGYLQPDGSLSGPVDGRCRTGDVGFLSGGELFLVERTKNIIIRHGQNHSAAVVERQLAGASGIPLDSVAVIESSILDADNVVCAVIEKPRGGFPNDLERTVRDAVTEFDLPVDRVMLIGRNEIPRTTSGKKQHASLRAAIRAGEVTVTHDYSIRGDDPVDDDAYVLDVDRTDLESKALTLIERHARRRGWSGASVSPYHRLAGDLGFDSLGLIELTVDIESALSCSMPEDRLQDLDTVRNFLDVMLEESSGMSLTEALNQISVEIPQVYRRVDLQLGRQLRVDGRWITDFASCNYLGLDLHPEVIESVEPALREWGTHPSWTRAVASPAIYFDVEQTIAEILGAPDVMLFSSISLLHLGVLPRLAGQGDTLIVDRTAHNSILEAVQLAEARGARVIQFDHRDLATLRSAMTTAQGRITIAVDGVYSMSGATPDLRAMESIAVEAGATLYVDDAHGFGILGRDPSPAAPYGIGGGGVVQHLGLTYDNIVYVAGLSKSYSSMGAFITCRNREERDHFELASTSIFTGPVPVASLATALAGFRVNASEGEERRARIWQLTDQIIRGGRDRGFSVDNETTFPIVNFTIGDVASTVAASQILWEHGLLLTPSVFPAAPLDRGGFRLSITAGNNEAEVAQLLRALDDIAERVGTGAPIGR